MPELSPQERLQPSLLDRLTDDAPEQSTEPGEKRIMSVRALKSSVQRDLSWLLNTRNLMPQLAPGRYPEIASSVLNYGISELTGISSTSLRREKLEHELLKAIRQFEPRLLANTIRLSVRLNPEQANVNALAFELSADMWAQPMPLQLYLETEMDLENGAFSFKGQRMA
ncbi:type VI secretion system baseplate subunit TssE [Thalassomonas viridans]|uniref:Type VI secretion system baseplate subunit TssE n=1 Tax=Thalassomonas viridans TaxID=137584 RepID=A0AAE9Z6R5_9GAMM|nr:type VI secretion system baseplate subunit TssE [Thalassomonas viridans]WDE07781.1 type VI secretion system baseplate subunit TssE [Thalassomonas viridans]